MTLVIGDRPHLLGGEAEVLAGREGVGKELLASLVLREMRKGFEQL